MSRQQIKEALQLYLVMGLEGNGRMTALELAEAAIRGGITMLQLREKKAALSEILEQGRQLRQLCRDHRIPFLVNDRVDVAILLNADGVHVGQDDIPGAEARKLLGPDKWIGVSAGNEEEAAYAVAQGADYLGVGAIYATMTKGDAGAPIGTSLLGRLSRQYPGLPLVGIGGIQADNAAEVIRAGASGIAVVSAVTKQADPAEAANRLLQHVRFALPQSNE